MQNYYILADTLYYIEANLKEELAQGQIAKNAGLSLSGLQRIFRYTFGYSMGEYIIKRRMTVAARELLTTDKTILQIAMQYRYNTPESFSRAFKRTWGILPSAYRKKRQYTELFTPIEVDDKGFYYRSSAELLDCIRQDENHMVICFDVVGLKVVNEISWEAGDSVLQEVVQRIQRIADPNTMRLFRIGGDEFALITAYGYSNEAQQFANQVLSLNGQAIVWNNQDIPVYLRVWYGLNARVIGYDNPFVELQTNVKYKGQMERIESEE